MNYPIMTKAQRQEMADLFTRLMNPETPLDEIKEAKKVIHASFEKFERAFEIEEITSGASQLVTYIKTVTEPKCLVELVRVMTSMHFYFETTPAFIDSTRN